jgi:hypothetical protein
LIKYMYLTKRKPGFTRDAFTIRWRKHGALGMSMPFWHHSLLYVQAEPIRPAPVPGASDEYDGIAYIVTNDEAFTAQTTPEDKIGAETMLKDELETFAGPIPPVMMWLKEEILKSGEPGGVTAFLFFTDAGKSRQTAEHYRKCSAANRVVLNNRRDDFQIPPFKSVLPYRATVEVSASCLAALKTIIEPGQDAVWRQADLLVVTREAVLWDRIS